MSNCRAAVFLDRDGVLIEDRDLLIDAGDIRILGGVPAALVRLKQAGFLLLVASNQAVIARGLISEAQLEAVHAEMGRLLCQQGAPPLDAIYYCPHHPQATLPEYRIECQCRKPRGGILRRAAAEHGLSLADSFMVGDRLTDIAAGASAGCRTVLLETGQHQASPIVTLEPLAESLRPDHTCRDLPAAVDWILEVR
jgi:D-glycero-D-manno-heptose 1,7-bisphosphate phosphatase